MFWPVNYSVGDEQVNSAPLRTWRHYRLRTVPRSDDVASVSHIRSPGISYYFVFHSSQIINDGDFNRCRHRRSLKTCE
jgi:hypothetical protein